MRVPCSTFTLWERAAVRWRTSMPVALLRVGPESAGADPGPICYGRGTRPTVTDANLLLGGFSLIVFWAASSCWISSDPAITTEWLKHKIRSLNLRRFAGAWCGW